MPFPDWQPGDIITAQRLKDMQLQSDTQDTDQTVNNSTTLVNSSIVIAVAASATYRIMLRASVRAAAAADIKFAWTGPTAATMDRFCWGPGTAATGGPSNFTDAVFRGNISIGTEIAYGTVTTGTSSAIFEDIIARISTTSGNLTLQFAQNVADASDCVLRAPTRADYIRIG